MKEISYLVGVPINYYGVVNLANFMTMIDMVGGIDINNPGAINDPTYDWLDGSPYGFKLAAGNQHLDGRHALAYARSRHGSGNSDYARAGRQQQLLVALEHKMATPSVVINLPTWTQQAGSLVRTDFPASQVADMVAAGQKVPADELRPVRPGSPLQCLECHGDRLDQLPDAGQGCAALDQALRPGQPLLRQDAGAYLLTDGPASVSGPSP